MSDGLIEGGGGEQLDECRSFVAGIGAGVYRTSPAGEILECNAAFARIFGFSSPEELKAVPAESLYLSPEDRVKWLAALRSRGAIPSGTIVMRRRDRTPVRVAYAERLVRGRAGAELIEGVLIELHALRRSRARAGQRWRILVVDDEAKLLRSVHRMLSEHEVVAASSVAEALEALEAAPDFDAVVSDVVMPAATGVDLYREILWRWPRMAPRVVFMSGGIGDTALSRVVTALGPPLLEKPFDRAQLLALVAAAARRR